MLDRTAVLVLRRAVPGKDALLPANATFDATRDAALLLRATDEPLDLAVLAEVGILATCRIFDSLIALCEIGGAATHTGARGAFADTLLANALKAVAAGFAALAVQSTGELVLAGWLDAPLPFDAAAVTVAAAALVPSTVAVASPLPFRREVEHTDLRQNQTGGGSQKHASGGGFGYYARKIVEPVSVHERILV